MCFTTKNFGGTAEVTLRDLTGFKVLMVKNKKLLSPIRDTKWTLGKVKIVKDFQKTAMYNSIHKGIHCYKTLTDAIRGFNDVKKKNSERKIFLVTIPKGTLVHINDTQYCAQKVILEDMKPLQFIQAPVKKLAKVVSIKKPIKKKPAKKK